MKKNILKLFNSRSDLVVVVSFAVCLILSLIFFKGEAFNWQRKGSIDEKMVEYWQENYSNNNDLAEQTWLYFATEYFDSKKIVVVTEQFDECECFSKIVDYIVPKEKVFFAEKDKYSIPNLESVLLQNCNYRMDDTLFVVDSSLETENEVLFVKTGSVYVFITPHTLQSVISNDEYMDVSPWENPFEYLLACSSKVDNRTKQVIFLVIVFTIGYWVASLSLGEEYGLLSFFTGPSIGCAIAVFSRGLQFILAAPNFLWIIINIAIVSFFIIRQIIVQKSAVKRVRNILSVIVAYSACVFAVVALQIVQFSPDSYNHIIFGRILSRFNSLMNMNKQWNEMVSFGLFGSLIHSIGCVVGVNSLYAIYPIVSISGIGALVAIYYYIFKTKNGCANLWVILLGGCLILVNVDYLYNSVSALHNGIVSTYFVMFIGLLILRDRTEVDKGKMLIILAASIITITRVEGACFVVAILFVYTNSITLREMNSSILCGVGIFIILFQIMSIYLNYGMDSTLFVSAQKSVFLALAGLGLVVMNFLLKNEKLLNIKAKYQILICILMSLGLMIYMLLYYPQSTLNNIFVFLCHFGLSDYSNSSAIWGYIIVVSLVSIFTNRGVLIEKDKILLEIIVLYLMLVMDIVVFRVEQPLHVGLSDSCRRIILQIMPTAVLLISILFAKRNNRGVRV